MSGEKAMLYEVKVGEFGFRGYLEERELVAEKTGSVLLTPYCYLKGFEPAEGITRLLQVCSTFHMPTKKDVE